MKIIGTVSSSTSTTIPTISHSDENQPTVSASVTANSNITYSLTINGDKQPISAQLIDQNPLQQSYITIRFPIDVLVQYVEGSSESLSNAISSLKQDFCGDNTMYFGPAIKDTTTSSTGALVRGGDISILEVLTGEKASGTPSWDSPITLTALSSYQNKNTYTAPTVTFHQHQQRQIRCIEAHLDVILYCPASITANEAVVQYIKPAIKAQLTGIHRHAESSLNHPTPLRILPYYPPGLHHHINLTYPLATPSIEADEEALIPLRTQLHSVFGLPADRPLLRVANALVFGAAGPSSGGNTTSSNSSKPGSVARLADVHKGLAPSGVKDGSLSLIDGSYDYYHYMQDRTDDSGWGCAYRSLQTICSWFLKQHYTARSPPSHKEIQQTLVALGDKPADFIGSRQWIGAIELGFVLDSLLGVQCKVITVASGAEMSTKAREIAQHFDTQGTPIMIGGGVLAYTLLGIDYNESTAECAFLILDPHYTGSDELGKVRSGQWIAWKRFGDKAAAGGELFVADAFYNLLCPQRPSTV